MRALRWLALCWVLCGSAAAGAAGHALTVAEAAVAGTDAWRQVALPHEWEATHPGFSGTLEYRLRFDAPAGELPALYVQRACTNLEVLVNGELVGAGGRMVPPVTRNCYYPHLFSLPRSLLKPQDNELRIRVAGFAANEVSARQRAAGLSQIELGPQGDLQRSYDAQLFWNITVAQVIATTVGALGVAMLALWAARRRDGYLLYFGLFTVGWALISARLFVRDLPLSHHVVELAICSAFPPVLACAYLFLMRLVDLRWPWMDRLLLVQAVLAPLLLWLALPELLPVATAVYNLLALEFLVCLAAFFRVAWRSHRGDFWLLGAVLVLALFLAGAEIALQNDLLALPKVHLIHFAMPLIFAVIGLRLIQLFVRALQQSETLNQQLEQRVAQKSEEIARNWQQIAQLQTAQAAQDERRRIASDLHDDLGAQLLTIAQASQAGGEPDRVARLARQAMEEMRLSVRGLTGSAAGAQDALADWRAETMTRLADAGLEGRWEADEVPPEMILPARTHVQLTRVLREAVSNAIRHARARRCIVRLRFPPGQLVLEVEDDGRGIEAAGARGERGHGLLNIERRVRNLRGEHRFAHPAGGGTRLCVVVPLAPTASNWGSP